MPVQGVWTPFGEVLCWDCHGQREETAWGKPRIIPDDETWAKRHEQVEVEEDWQRLTRCQKCRTEIVVRWDVAKENDIALRLQEVGIPAEMWQMGGMTSALGMSLDNKAYLLAGEDDTDPEKFSVWFFADDDDEGSPVAETVTADRVAAIFTEYAGKYNLPAYLPPHPKGES